MNKQQSPIRKQIALIKYDCKLLQDLRFIQNELISNTGYHEKNMETQIKQLERANAPKDELNLIKRSYHIRFEYSKILLRSFEDILNKLEKGLQYANTNTKTKNNKA